ncbi:MAG: EF-hand domain-containing protein [Henriciella sp.]
MTRTLLLSVAAFCAFSASAGEDIQFSTVDANADGFISESEFVGWKTATGEYSAADALVKFIEIDADASGMISEEEMKAAMATKETSESTNDDQM